MICDRDRKVISQRSQRGRGNLNLIPFLRQVLSFLKRSCTIAQIFFQGDFVADSPKPADLPKATKQDIPNRFWAMVEPYCTEISNDDLKV